MSETQPTRSRLAEIARNASRKVRGGEEQSLSNYTLDGTEGGTQSGLPPPPPGGELEVEELQLDLVVDGRYQPRLRTLGKKDVDELMRTLSANGQTSPIIVVPGSGEHEGKYELLSGHRRCAALRFLGATTVKAILRKDLDERAARKLALVDNMGRDDLTAYEQAKALRDFADAFNLTVEQAGKELGLRQRSAFRLKAILEASEELQARIRDWAIPAKPADLLVRLESKDAGHARRLAKRYRDGKVNSTDLERALQEARNRAPTARGARDVDFTADERRVQLKVVVALNERSDAQTDRIVEAVARLLGHLGVPRVDALGPGPEPEPA